MNIRPTLQGLKKQNPQEDAGEGVGLSSEAQSSKMGRAAKVRATWAARSDPAWPGKKEAIKNLP